MALKVCQVCAVDFTLKHFLLPLIDAMKKEGWTVTSVCSDGPNIAELRAKGYIIEPICIARNFNVLRHFKTIICLTRYFKDNQFDIVHVHTPVAALIARIAARLASVPLVIYTAHGFYFHDEMSPIKRWFFILLERWVGRFTDILFTQSQEDALSAEKERLAPNGVVHAIGNGVDPEKFDPKSAAERSLTLKSLKIPENSFVIGVVARLVREKGICEFIDAAIQTIALNDNLYFIVVGSRLNSDRGQRVANVIEKAISAHPERILFLGQRADIPDLISAMDVFCLPSWREGMPRSIIEAMMLGKPIVATNIRGSREEVIDGETGFLLPIRNSNFLAKTFLHCAANPKKLMKMGEEGRIKALRDFDENNVVKIQIDFIQSFLVGREKHEASL